LSSGGRAPKFIRDPIHDIIRIDDPFILDLLNSAAMQRLRRIRQLGLAWLVYPGAEHSRFTHSLGVFNLAGRVIHQLEDEARLNGRPDTLFNENQRKAVLSAALLHDVGHGPFSHAFEHVIASVSGKPVPHENWTKKIIENEQDVRQALSRSGSPTIVEDVVEIIDGVATPHYLTAVVSSQLDVDRFDYLLRDSRMTGAQYGRFDLEWMLRTLAVRTVLPGGLGATQPIETIVVDGRRGLDGLEAHLIGRHYMYRHVYFHKTIRAAEQILRGIFRRVASLTGDGAKLTNSDAFNKLVSGQGDTVSTSEYLTLDDFTVLAWIEEWARTSSDHILADLSNRLIKRQLFKAIVLPAGTAHRTYMNNRAIVERETVRLGYDPEFYFLEDTVKDVAYRDFFYNLQKEKDVYESQLWYLDRSGKPRTLSSFEDGITVQARRALEYQNEFWFIPQDVAGTEAIQSLNWS
jgi:HD superfamily phosphohydrolase